MEQGIPGTSSDPIPGNEDQAVTDCADQFDKEGAQENFSEELDQPDQGIQVKGILQQDSVFQCDFSTNDHHNTGGEGYDTQTA